MEILTAYLALRKAPFDLIEKVISQITTEGAWKVIEEYGFEAVGEDIAENASNRSERYLFSQAVVGTVLLKDRKKFYLLTREPGRLEKEPDGIFYYSWNRYGNQGVYFA
jgi:cobalamin biosynthesis protein CbiD